MKEPGKCAATTTLANDAKRTRRKAEPNASEMATAHAIYPLAQNPSVSCIPLPEAQLRTWRESLDAHDGTQPVWLPKALLADGLVADTLSHAPHAPTADAAGCEMWAQRRPPSSSMHLHFDCDEEHARTLVHDGGGSRPPNFSSSALLRCPMRTCVLYTSDSGGPTLVLQRSPGEEWRDEVRCFACWPRAGQILSFPGDWLHGILPGSEEAATGADDEAANAGAADAADVNADGGGDDGSGGGVRPSDDAADADDADVAGDGDSDGGSDSDGDRGGKEAAALRETIVLNLWRHRPMELPELGAEDVPVTVAPAAVAPAAGVTDRAGAGAGAAAIPGAPRGAWKWHTLTIGTFDGMRTLELWMPTPARDDGHALQSWTARLRAPVPDWRRIGPFYG